MPEQKLFMRRCPLCDFMCCSEERASHPILGALSPSVDGQPKKFGFLATRVVEAPDTQRAVELATAQVRQDERIRDSSTGGMIVPDEVHSVSWFFRRLSPPRGFTFFLEETEPDQ